MLTNSTLHDLNNDNLTAATLIAGTYLVQPSVFTIIFSYLVSGFIGTWWQLSWSKPQKAQTKWWGQVDPHGQRYVEVRDKALRQNWEDRAAGGGLTVQGSDEVDSEGRRWRDTLQWGDEEQEQRRMQDREKRKEALKDKIQPVPQYILDYAPYVYLYSMEEYWPGDLEYHLKHTIPKLNQTAIIAAPNYPTSNNLALLNAYAPFVYLTGEEDVEAHPAWLSGRFNIPDKTGYSKAPATLVWIDKGNGVVDAFWFFFYSYNLGNVVFNVRFGDHVGDWEHTLVRFVDGEPKWIFMSQHEGGDSYTYKAVEKRGKRPVVYSAIGTHAMYGTPGRQEYVVPLGLLADNTDRGSLWDPALNSRMYHYNSTEHLLLPSSQNPDAPTEWFWFDGRWGDKKYADTDPRQYHVSGEYHYVSGPTGPRWKSIMRKSICHRDDEECVILTQLRRGRKKWMWEMDPLDGGVDVPWWALGGLDWYIMCWSTVEWLVNVFIIKH